MSLSQTTSNRIHIEIRVNRFGIEFQQKASNISVDMIKKSLFLALLAFASGAVFSSCNTTAGFGEDLQKVGSKLEKKAEDTGGTE